MTEAKKVGSGLNVSGKKRPASWIAPTLGEVYTVVGGGTPSTEKADYWDTGTSWVTSADIYGVRDIRPRKKVTTKGIENSTTQVVPHKTLLVVTRVGLGKIAITETETCFSQDVQGLIQRPDFIAPEFALYFLNYELQILKHQGRGTTISGITKKQLTDLEFPLPPFNEQQRIVAKIEELFSELDKGVENLRTAQQQLKVYRQALLKHAFEGKLTADWRAQNPDKLESADALLARIRQEREACYQQQVQDWQTAQQAWDANGKTGSKPRKPKAPKTLQLLTADELKELPKLPKGWTYTPLSYVGDLGRGKSKHRPRNDSKLFGGPYPFIQTGEVKAANRVIRKYSNTYSELGLEQSKLWPQGTLCITIAANIAETAFLGFDGCFPDSIVGFSALNELIAPEYVDFFIQGARTSIEAYAPATAQKNINLETLENLIIPFCGSEEQKALLQALDKKLSILDQLEQTITHSLQQAEALRQSILKKAFSGQLVAQDANDEPASVLLERIKAEKLAKPPANTRKARTAPAALPNNVVPMPVRIPGIASTDLHAGILALAYSAHEAEPKYLAYFGHVKGEKVSHLVEAHLGIELDRAPVKDAAGPNDYPHLKKVESRARKVGWFDMRREPGATAYSLHKLAGFNELQVKTRQALGPRLSEVEALLRLLLPLNTRQAEIVATLYAAWNNLLLAGLQPSDQQIIFEARDNWHPDKLKIEQERFEKGLHWMKAKGLVPNGQGRSVMSKPA